MCRWLFIFATGIISWLRVVFNEDEIMDIRGLINTVRLYTACADSHLPPAQVKANLPVKHLVGWLYYGASFQWGNKRAVRTGRTTRVDFMWRYSLVMYALTNKNIYKFGCIQNIKAREDCVPMVRTAIEEYGTLSESGRPCSGIELDFTREHVSAPMHRT